jgi:anti-sigma factor RsiW
MKRRMFPEHPNDEELLAYVDGEIPSARIRTIRNHLRSCWKCRFILADLESQAEAISRVLSIKLDSNFNRSFKAKEKFLRWRASFEKRQISLFGKRSFILLADMVRVAPAQ